MDRNRKKGGGKEVDRKRKIRKRSILTTYRKLFLEGYGF